jgi:hypothetical protein
MPEGEYSVLGPLNDPIKLLNRINQLMLEPLELSVISNDTHETEHLTLRVAGKRTVGFGQEFTYRILKDGVVDKDRNLTITITQDVVFVTIFTS